MTLNVGLVHNFIKNDGVYVSNYKKLIHAISNGFEDEAINIIRYSVIDYDYIDYTGLFCEKSTAKIIEEFFNNKESIIKGISLAGLRHIYDNAENEECLKAFLIHPNLKHFISMIFRSAYKAGWDEDNFIYFD